MILEQFIDENKRYNKILVCENKVKLTLGCNGREFYKILIDTKDTSKLKK